MASWYNQRTLICPPCHTTDQFLDNHDLDIIEICICPFENYGVLFVNNFVQNPAHNLLSCKTNCLYYRYAKIIFAYRASQKKRIIRISTIFALNSLYMIKKITDSNTYMIKSIQLDIIQAFTALWKIKFDQMVVK